MIKKKEYFLLDNAKKKLTKQINAVLFKENIRN